MRTLVFDTETTGKTVKGADLSAQPYIVQIAAVLFDERRPIAHFSAVTIPEFRGVRAEIPKEASDIHGVTDDFVDRVGVPYNVALPMFNNLAKRADRLVAHNIEFDDILIRAAYSRDCSPSARSCGICPKCAP
jgi:DNA polymerase-3 subunit epsilon